MSSLNINRKFLNLSITLPLGKYDERVLYYANTSIVFIISVIGNVATEVPIRRLRRTLIDGHCPKLRSLFISGNKARSAVLEFFQSSFGERVPYIEVFEAASNELDLTTDAVSSGVLMQGQLSMSHFTHIDLSYNPLGDHGLGVFLGVCLQPGAIFNPSITAEGRLLQEPASSLRLTQLHLNDVEMSSGAMKIFSKALEDKKMVRLQTLSLSSNALMFPDVESILQALETGSLPDLQELNLSMNNIGDQGLGSIGSSLAAGHLDNIRRLDISETGANSHSISYLTRLFELRFRRNRDISLRVLKLFGNQPLASKFDHGILSAEFIDRVAVS